MLALKAKNREIKENLEEIRKAGELPAVFYGMGNPATSISIPVIEFKKVWKKAGESSTIKITTPTTTIDALIQEVQTDPVTDEPIHVDFLVVDMNKEVEIEVPLEFIGISEAVKSGLGTLVKVLHEVTIKALPKDLPHVLEVDISNLATIESQILVSEIKLPAHVKMITKDTEVVASIAVQKEEKEEVVTEPVDLSKIEVEKKGKREEEGGEAPVVEEKS